MAHADESAQLIGDSIIKDLNLFRGCDRPIDDVTMVVVNRIWTRNLHDKPLEYTCLNWRTRLTSGLRGRFLIRPEIRPH